METETEIITWRNIIMCKYFFPGKYEKTKPYIKYQNKSFVSNLKCKIVAGNQSLIHTYPTAILCFRF